MRKNTENNKIKTENSQIQLIQSNRIHTLGLITAGVIHELNNPMMGILNFTQYCLSQTPENDKRYPILQDIEHATNRCIAIVQNLLSVVKAKSDDIEPFIKCNIASILNTILQLMSYYIIRYHVSLSQTIEKDLPEIYLQKNNIQLLLINLLLNALHAIENQEIKKIDIAIKKNNEIIRLKISDTGNNIPLKDMDQIFNSVFSSKIIGKETASRLSVCYRIVEMHHGNIRVEQTSTKRTTFVVELPIRQGEKDVQENTCH